MIVVHCYTCRAQLAKVETVARAEQVLWDHIDETGHDVARWELEPAGSSDRAMA